jgi:hypothetical protein
MTQLPQKDVFSISFCPVGEAQIPFYTSSEKGLEFNAAVPTEIARHLQLTYDLQEDASTEVCYLNSPELRSEFKVSFTRLDLSDYLNAVLSSAAYDEEIKRSLNENLVFIPYETDLDVFWKLVEAGKTLRQQTPR